jgi:hypothetical protein
MFDFAPPGLGAAAKRVAYRAYLALNPNEAEIWFRFGNHQWLAGHFEPARAAYRRALESDPGLRAEIVRQLILMRGLDEALVLAEPALKRGEGWALASTARIFRLRGCLDEARAMLARAQGSAVRDASVLAQQAMLSSEEGRFAEALDQFEQACAAEGKPDAYWEERYWLLLATGRIAEAFPLTRFRKRKSALALPPIISLWAPGDAFAEAPFVIAEQGLGDEIKFATCYQDLLRDAPGAVIACHPRLRALLERSFPSARFVPVERLTRGQKRTAALLDARGQAALAKAEQCIVAADLLGQYRTDVVTFETRAPMLVADPALRKKWRKRLDALGPGPKIGLSWTTLGQHPERMPRYAALEAWLPVLATPDMHFVNLQHGVKAETLKRAADQGTPLQVWDDFNVRDDLDDLAALMTELDLVISAHSMTKELAGAVGARTWLVYHNADPQLAWRRRSDGSDLWFKSIEHVVDSVPVSVTAAIAAVQDRLARTFGPPKP